MGLNSLFVTRRILSLASLAALGSLTACSTQNHASEVPADSGRFPAAIPADTCAKIMTRFIDFDSSSVATRAIKRYPKGFNAQAHAGGHLMYGFESEYTMKDLEKLVNVYGPKPEFLPRDQWLAKSTAERVQWIEANITTLFPENRKAGGLVKTTELPELAFLPPAVIRDETGNIEVVLAPVDTLEEFTHQANLVNEHMGIGSMQGSTSSPVGAFFPPNGLDVSTNEVIKEKIGYFNFMGDMDTITKLEVGASRFERDSTKSTAMSFQHAFLGPMTKLKHSKMVEFFAANARGAKFDKNSMQAIAGTDASFKYFGGSAYRPDIVPMERVILEVRDCHTSMTCLMERMLRNTFHMQYGYDQFWRSMSLKPFDSVKDYAKLPEGARQALESVFPSKMKPGVDYNDEEKLALEVYRNFAWPMRDWSSHVELLGRPKLAEKIQTAQNAYVSKLNAIAQELAAGTIDKKAASVRIQGAISVFGKESEIGRSMRDWELRYVMNDRTWSSYANLAVREVAPFKQAFPGTVKLGPLAERVKSFTDRWPNNVKMVKDVEFSFTSSAGKVTKRKRNVLVLTTNGLSEADQAKLQQEYLDSLSAGTVSFPLGEGAGHLYTRVGNQTTDFYFGSNAQLNAYRLPGSPRLEPFIALRPEEELRLRAYMDGASTKGSQVIGPSNYQGAADGKTAGKLRNNRPTGRGGHNCTSWMCTAPVAYNEAPLMTLVGAGDPANEVHTNPGWWSNWLTGGAPGDRVPFVAYWNSNQPLEQITAQEVKEGQPFRDWNFALH